MENEITVHSLNNDCLIHIFEYLEVKEKLKIEGVCQRWNQVVKESWSYVTYLPLDDILPFKKEINDNKKNLNTSVLLNILEKCSKYLKNLCISCVVKKCTDFTRILDSITLYCKNISSLKIDDDYSEKGLSDEDLKILLNCSRNLSSIHFSNLYVECKDLFKNIRADNIKNLSINYCNFESNSDFYYFVAKLKNLERFVIYDCYESRVDSILNVLCRSECENISSAAVILDEDTYVEKLPFFLFKQKKLNELWLSCICIDENYLGCLSLENLKYLNLHYCDCESSEIQLNFFQYLKKLEVLDYTNASFDDICLEAIAKNLLNIKKLNISFSECEVSDESEYYFNNLKNLESFSVACLSESPIIENLLDKLTGCLNLKSLTLDKCYLTKYMLQTIGSLSNLITLHIRNCDKVTDKNCGDLLKKLLNLKEFKISCFSVTSKLIEIASNIKKNRQDSHVLKMIFYESPMNQNEMKVDLSKLTDLSTLLEISCLKYDIGDL